MSEETKEVEAIEGNIAHQENLAMSRGPINVVPLVAGNWYCVYLNSVSGRFPSGFKFIATLSIQQNRNSGYANVIVESGFTEGFAGRNPANMEITVRKQDKEFTVDLAQGLTGTPETIGILMRFSGTINPFLGVTGVYSVPDEIWSPFITPINLGNVPLTASMNIGGVILNCSGGFASISTATNNIPNYSIAKFVGSKRVF